MTFRELSQKVIIRFAELSIIYGLKFLRKELKESKEVNGVSIVTVISWIMCTLARDTSIKGCPFSFWWFAHLGKNNN